MNVIIDVLSMKETRISEIEKKGRKLVGMKDDQEETTPNTSNRSPQDVATASPQNVATASPQNVATASPQDAETNHNEPSGSSHSRSVSTVGGHRSYFVVSLTLSTRSKTGIAVGVHYNRSKNQEESIDSQLKETNTKKAKVTGAAGEVNSEYYDFSSITLDKVKKITSDEGTYREMKSLVGHSSMSSVFMKGL